MVVSKLVVDWECSKTALTALQVLSLSLHLQVPQSQPRWGTRKRRHQTFVIIGVAMGSLRNLATTAD